MILSTQQIDELKNTLTAKRDELRRLIENLKRDLDFGSDVDSGDEETDESEGYSNYIGVEQALKRRITRVTEALERVEAGTYGTCVTCRKEIAFDALKSNPDTARCSSCRTKK